MAPVDAVRITAKGNVGVGTITPNSSLTIVGEAQVGNSGAACVTGTNGGAIRYSAGTLYYCNGSNTWATIGTGGGTLTGGGSATAIAFWNGTSSLTYESATTSGFYWDHANGRLGVGTNSPVVGLTISSTSGLAFDSAAAKSISWYTGGGYPVQIRGDASNVYLAFLLGGREAARFNTAGNLGIGTQSPTATLQVSGTFTVSQTGQNTASAASMLVDERGVSVSSVVHITGSPISPVGAGGNVILSGTTAVSTSSAGSITFYTGGSQAMGIDSSGRVGIGAGTNANKFNVHGGNIRIDGSAVPALYISATSGDLYAFSANTSIPGAGIWDNTTGVWPISIKDTSGYVGINTVTQGYRLTVTGDTGNGATFQRAAIGIVDTGTSGRTYSLASRGVAGFIIGDETAGTQRLTIAPNGVFTLTGTSTCTLANGTGTTSCTSDRRLKDRIEPIEGALDKLMLIKGVTYHWKRKDISEPEHIGVIAQDVEKAFPQAVTEVSDTTIGTAKTVDYSILVAPIIEALREFKHRSDVDHENLTKLKAANDNLANETAALKSENAALKSANDNMVRRLETLERKVGLQP